MLGGNVMQGWSVPGGSAGVMQSWEKLMRSLPVTQCRVRPHGAMS